VTLAKSELSPMDDPKVDQDPLVSSFENAAVDAAAAADAPRTHSMDGGDANDETGEHLTSDQDVGLVTSALEREVTEQKERYLRLYAEFENFRRRAVRDRQDAELKGMQNLLRGLLETIDDVARFAHVDPATTDSKTLVDGVAMVEKKLLKSLAGHGLEVVDPKGKPFDPAVHEAITTTPAPTEAEDHLVAQVYQVGYVLNGTLLRPARVVVMQWNG
jgi:molecular chaperone GrpE